MLFTVFYRNFFNFKIIRLFAYFFPKILAPELLLSMFLLSPELLNFERQLVTYAYFFRVIPFKYHKTHDTFYIVQTSKWNLYKFDVIVYLTVAHYIFIWIRFYQNLSEIDCFSYSDPRLTIYVCEGMYIISLSIALVLQLTLFHFKQAVPRLMNQVLNFSKFVQSKKKIRFYSLRFEKFYVSLIHDNVHISDKFGRKELLTLETPPWQTKVQVIIKLQAMCSIFSYISLFIFFCEFPNEKLLLSSLIFSQYLRVYKSLSWWIFLIGLVVNTWIFLVGWASVIFCSAMFLIFIYTFIFLMQELK